jgi:hypothetical protein
MEAKIIGAFRTATNWRAAQGIAEDTGIPLDLVLQYIGRNPSLFTKSSLGTIPVFGLSAQGKEILYQLEEH